MKLYNAIIREVNARLSEAKAYTPGPCWEENADFEMVMLRDAAYELGGDGKPTVNFTCVTTDEALVPGDEIMVIGPDLSELTGSSAATTGTPMCSPSASFSSQTPRPTTSACWSLPRM